MAPDLGEMPRHAACPACGAALRPGSPWCTLCYADLRPPEERPTAAAPAAEPVAAPAPVMGDPLTQPLIDFLPGAVPQATQAPTATHVPQPAAPVDPLGLPVPESAVAPRPEPTWPCTRCGSANPLASARCAACGAAFLEAVSIEGRSSVVLPIVGDLMRLSRMQRLLGATGVAIAILVLVALVTLIIG